MTAYMDLNGIPAAGNRWLFTHLLRDTWAFEGFVVSDADAVRNLVTHGFAADLADAGARAVTAGVDMEMAAGDPAYSRLPEALANGDITERHPGRRRAPGTGGQGADWVCSTDPYVDAATGRVRY